jgi:hypothetical protein
VGDILGVAKMGSLEGTFSSSTNDITEIVATETGSGIFNIALASGELQRGVADIRSNFVTGYDRRDFEIYDYPRIVLDAGDDERGGVTVDLEGRNFTNRTIKFQRLTDSGEFELIGPCRAPCQGLSWMDQGGCRSLHKRSSSF